MSYFNPDALFYSALLDAITPERSLDPPESKHGDLTERLLRDRAYQEWPEDRRVIAWLHDQPEHMETIARAAVLYRATPWQMTKDELDRVCDSARQDYIEQRLQTFDPMESWEITRAYLERTER